MKKILLLTSFLLVSCAGYNEGITKCGKVRGLECHSLSQVYEKINNGEISTTKNANKTIDDTNIIAYKRSHISDRSNNYVSYEIQNTRTNEEVMRVWFAPHIDQAGNLIDETMTYMVIDEGKWAHDVNWGQYGKILSKNY